MKIRNECIRGVKYINEQINGALTHHGTRGIWEENFYRGALRDVLHTALIVATYAENSK